MDPNISLAEAKASTGAIAFRRVVEGEELLLWDQLRLTLEDTTFTPKTDTVEWSLTSSR